MIRLLLGGTALTAMLVTGALAQSSSSSMDSSMSSGASSMASSASSSAPSSSSTLDSSMMSSQMSTASSMESSMMSSAPATGAKTSASGRTQVNILSGYTQADTDHLASKIIGSPVYDGTGSKANNLGKITDFIVDENGGIAAVIVGVGGFLGIGEKQVAVDFSALKWTIADDKSHRFVLQTTKDQLTSAPDFKTIDASSAAASGSTEQATSSTGAGLTASSSAQQ